MCNGFLQFKIQRVRWGKNIESHLTRPAFHLGKTHTEMEGLRARKSGGTRKFQPQFQPQPQVIGAPFRLDGSTRFLKCMDCSYWWLMFLMLLAVTVMAAVIISTTASTNSIASYEEAYNSTIDNPCDDANNCTVDIFQLGGCSHSRVPDTTECETGPCHTATGACQGGLCKGNCKGTCVVAGDCPSIDFVTAGDCTKTCSPYQDCFYTCTLTGSGLCGEDSEHSTEVCQNNVVPMDTLGPCLRVESRCNGATDLTCVYTFQCSEPVPIS